MLGQCVTAAPTDQFLTRALAYIDCQSRVIGAYGYEAMSGSAAATAAVLTLLTLFIALFGARMMFGHLPAMRELAISIAKIGIVLMLVTSWPAVRTLFFDTAVTGPSELAGRIIGGAESSSSVVVQRMQNVDSAIVRLTAFGTGRNELNSTRTADGQLAAEAFAGVALTDALALGGARYAWLAGALAVLGTLRLTAGILIALLPLFAGFLLFEATRGLFGGWLRALVALILANACVLVILSVELAFVEPWLQQILAQRLAYVATPSAPTELLVITTAFAALMVGVVFILFRMCFGHFPSAVRAGAQSAPAEHQTPLVQSAAFTQTTAVPALAGPSGAGASRQMLLATAVRRGERHIESAAPVPLIAAAKNAVADPDYRAGDIQVHQQRRSVARTARSRLKRDQM